jgi:hypothetical protein
MQDNPSVYFYVWGIDNVAYGPVELPTLVSWVRDGRVFPETWIFHESKADWTQAGELTETKALFKFGAAGGQSATRVHGITPASLRRMKVLADMEERHLVSFLQYMEVVEFLPNATVFRKGEDGDAMFLVLEGEVRARVVVDGRESTLMTMGVGECFGELAVIEESVRSADVIANEETVLLRISAVALKRLLREAPTLAAPFLLALNKTTTARFRRLTKVYEDTIHIARQAAET